MATRSAPIFTIPDGEDPSSERLAALSQILTSFYTGLGRIFDRIAKQVDGSVPIGERWHAEERKATRTPGQRRASFRGTQVAKY